ncbi:MAG TPA: SDR family NAD(P)-dependent oxidoreductase [Lapillicoccus sp.]|nr:SDR family NAD(P)-dependent oxidoreductase [Lapillicoccus sp.]
MTRVAVVTGATAGIGRAVAVRLAAQGFRVIGVGRDERRGAELVDALDAVTPGGYAAAHRFLRADLASMADTASLAIEVGRLTDRVEALVCCAGVLALRPEWTEEGLERTFALNYLSRFLLVRRLEPLLRRARSGRVVLVANAGRYGDTLDLDDPDGGHGARGLRVSARTQVANDLLAVELAERYRGTPVTATCVFPGFVRTDVFRHGVGVPRPLAGLLSAVVGLVGLTPDQAADTPSWLAGDADPNQLAASFFGPHRTLRRIPDDTRRPERREALWALSERLTAAWSPVSVPAPATPGPGDSVSTSWRRPT